MFMSYKGKRLQQGALMAIGAGLMWLFSSKKGREVRTQILDYAAEAYTTLRKEVMESEEYGKLTKQRYVVLVKQVIDDYAKDHQISDKMKRTIARLLTNQWAYLKKELKEIAGEAKKETKKVAKTMKKTAKKAKEKIEEELD